MLANSLLSNVNLPIPALVKGLTLPECDVVAKYFTLAEYAPGDYIFHLGDQATEFYMIFSGTVIISFINPNGDEKVISILWAGDAFGHLFLGSYRHRIGSARVLEPTTLASISESSFIKLSQSIPQFCINFVRLQADQQRQGLARLHALLHHNARQRLLGTLLNLARHDCCAVDDWFYLPNCVTQEHLASIAGMNRSTASLLINEFRQQKLLSGQGRQIKVNTSRIKVLLNAEGIEFLE